jgi:hypothetical protein
MLVLCLKSLEAEQTPISATYRDIHYLHTVLDSPPRIVWIGYPAVDSKATLSSICPRLVMFGVLTMSYDVIHSRILLTMTHASINSNKFYKSCQYKILLFYEESGWRPIWSSVAAGTLVQILLQIFFVIEISPRVQVSIILLCTVLFIIHSVVHQYLFCLYHPNYISINQLVCPSRIVIDVVNINS